MKKQVLFGLVVLGLTTVFAAPVRAGGWFSFSFGIPIPVPCLPQVVVAAPAYCPPPVYIPRPPVVYCPPPITYFAPPVAYCPPRPVVVYPPVYAARPYGYAYGRYQQRGGYQGHR